MQESPMPRLSRLTVAKDDILRYFKESPKKVYSEAELSGVLVEQHTFWRLAKRTTTTEFANFLAKQGELRPRVFRSENYNREVKRYSWGEASAYELALSLRPRGYLSHATAVALHGLTDLIPKTLFLNVEQSPKPGAAGSLAQRGIDQAFSRKQRQSNLTYQLDDWAVTIVAGKNTDQLGVEEITGPLSEVVRVTNLERTLIDIVVRPAYAGGIFQVFQAYRAAKDQISTNRLVALLKKLNYVYPYHQAIGFLMQRAGYPAKPLELLRDLGIDYKFYLVHGIQKPEYDPHWRLFYPQGLES
jgi:predicted transcriptional regulator of viral defense system